MDDGAREDPGGDVGPGGAQRVDGRRLRYRHRREELLRAATEHVLDHGLEGLSLRVLARSAGVSHAALLHHFATREQLVAEVVAEVLDRAFSAPGLVAGDPPGGPLRALWHHATTDPGQRAVRLFIAITGTALYGDGDTARAVRRSVRERTALLREGLVREGCPEQAAGPLATLALSTMRGLAVDRLLTGDAERVDAAFELFVRGLEAQQRAWG
ncbi:TetR/AcrR family transcriptional regulator [Kineococcus sp. SYSU DK004]|uniref:TetR/AcrR family transcriptional regulator n=1 Tax=Kineococcus sp. SYSU DK004 TaxID=3383125 RepID=UPI003D7ED6B8